MRRKPLIVLKFGGSVLGNADALTGVVHEIYRWRREGWRVLAVVSALAGRTDALGTVCHSIAPRLDGCAEAGVRALGELECAALLSAHLDRAGVPASVVHPATIGLRAVGDALDATPAAVDAPALHRALDRDGVVVVPGYAALDREDRVVTLGRGGSDLSALFLASALGAARCRLVKDVDGLYDRDPKLPGAHRYGASSFADALATDGTIVQHKAVRWARARGLAFEIGDLQCVRPTVVWSGPSRYAASIRLDRPQTVALLGLGTVGGGVAAHLRDMPDAFEVIGVAVWDAARRRDDVTIPLTADAVGLASSGADIVVEAMGGVEAALAAVCAALEAGSDVVTANKSLIATHGRNLVRLARLQGRRLLYSAAVGGSAPVVERACAGGVVSVRGVLNGTANFVLERMAAGAAFDDALVEARTLGLAEADAARDLDGRDAADKARALALAMGLPAPQVERWCASPRERTGGRMRQVVRLDGDGASVGFEPVAPDDSLFDLPEEWNCAVLQRDDGAVEVVRGRGAGRWPTAESVLGDLLELHRERVALAAGVREVAHA
ncbi:MAG: homoserine dehydrogenase [Phycisphaerales bacterium]